MQTVTLREILNSGYRALFDGSLSMLSSEPLCSYRYDAFSIQGEKRTFNCVVGSALDKKTLDELDTKGQLSVRIPTLVDNGIIDVPENERERVFRLQKFHDSLCFSIKHGEITCADATDRLRGYMRALEDTLYD